MKYLFLILFILFTTFHLYASYNKKTTLRARTKPFILLSLLGFYVYSTKSIDVFLVLALIFSWIGDLFLILKGIKWFSVGGISFMISHIFFILCYSKEINFESINMVAAFVIATVFIVFVYQIFVRLKPYLSKALFYPMFLYLLINGTMNMYAIFRLMGNVNIYTITTCIGAILFFISDTALFFVRFNKNSILKTHFIVMLTYSLGEFLIVLGLI